MATNNPRPTKAERREQARAQAKAMREEQARREKRAKIARRSILGVGVVAVAGVGAGLYLSSQGSDGAGAAVPTTQANKTGVPKVVLSDGSWTYGKELTPGSTTPGAKTVEVFFDYSCHFCAAFESLHADEIHTLLESGVITLALRPCKILGQSWTDMVMNAQGIVLDKAPEKALDFHRSASDFFTKIYQAQDASMMTADNVVVCGQDAGLDSSVTDLFADAISSNTYGAWTELGTKTFSDRGFTGTPTVLVDGEQVDLQQIATADGLTTYLKS